MVRIKGRSLQKEWVRKAPEKDIGFDQKRAKEAFMEANKSFIEASTSGINENSVEEMDPSKITTFLETCMKIHRDSKAVKGL